MGKRCLPTKKKKEKCLKTKKGVKPKKSKMDELIQQVRKKQAKNGDKMAGFHYFKLAMNYKKIGKEEASVTSKSLIESFVLEIKAKWESSMMPKERLMLALGLKKRDRATLSISLRRSARSSLRRNVILLRGQWRRL